MWPLATAGRLIARRRRVLETGAGMPGPTIPMT
jgi:hypothetical protein